MRLAEEDKSILFAVFLMLFLGLWAARLHRPEAPDAWTQLTCGDLYARMTLEGQCQFDGG
jgi:hypothetical protein